MKSHDFDCIGCWSYPTSCALQRSHMETRAPRQKQNPRRPASYRQAAATSQLTRHRSTSSTGVQHLVMAPHHRHHHCLCGLCHSPTSWELRDDLALKSRGGVANKSLLLGLLLSSSSQRAPLAWHWWRRRAWLPMQLHEMGEVVVAAAAAAEPKQCADRCSREGGSD